MNAAASPGSGKSAYLALGLGLSAIGFSAIFVSLADAPGTVSAFYRMAIGALVIMPLFVRRVRSEKADLTWSTIRPALLGGLLFAVDLSFWASGVVLSGATKPTLMANTAPLWVGLGSLLIFRESLNARFWLGLALAMAGAVMVLGVDFRSASQFDLGTFLGLTAAVFYGAYYLVTQWGRIRLSALTYFWITTATAALALLVISLALGHSVIGYDRRTYLVFLASGVLAQGLGWLVITYAQGYLPAAIVAPTLLGQPVVTAIFAILLLDEQLTPGHILGGIAVLTGVYIVHWSRRRDHKALAVAGKVSPL